MSPETPPPTGPDPERSQSPPFGPESQLVIDEALLAATDPEQALRIMKGAADHGAAFAAYLKLPDTTTGPDVAGRFEDTYVDAWRRYAEFRADMLETMGWTEALAEFRRVQGRPKDHLTWNTAAIDQQLHDTYDLVHLDGWWHAFHK